MLSQLALRNDQGVCQGTLVSETPTRFPASGGGGSRDYRALPRRRGSWKRAGATLAAPAARCASWAGNGSGSKRLLLATTLTSKSRVSTRAAAGQAVTREANSNTLLAGSGGGGGMELGLTGKCQEVLERQDCEVTGTVPAWLTATLLRNGPGTFDVELEGGRGNFTVPHWFDGLTQLHEWSLNGSAGTVQYRSRHLYPGLEEHIKKHGFYGTFAGIHRSQTWLGGLASLLLRTVGLGPKFSPAGEMNLGVTIGHVANTLYTKSDVNALAEIDPATLKAQPSTSYTKMNAQFKGFLSAAHGQRDEARRTYYNYTLDFTPGGVYHLFGIPDDEPQGHLLASIPADPAYIHSFAQTERYLVLMVSPLLLSVPRLAVFLSPGQAMSWQPDKGTLFYVVDKQAGGAGHVATYKSDAFFCFHNINAWEDKSGGLVLDLCGYDNDSWFDTFRLPNLRSGHAQPPRVDVRRYTLPDLAAAIAAGPSTVHTARHATIADASTPGGVWTYELPRINKGWACRPYRFMYCAAAASRESPFFDAIAKLDVESGETQLWRQEGHFPGEPIFVGRPGGEREEDGLLLVVVLAGPEKHSYLLMLDAGTMQEVARAAVKHVIGFGFHGNLFGTDGSSTDLA